MGSEASRADAGRAFRRAQGRRAWQFPRDHGQHPAFKLEWWYFTGVLRTASGRRFGFQVTIFRQGLRPGASKPGASTPGGSGRRSAWAADSVYMGHAALSDIAAGRMVSAGRLARGAAGLAGAAPDRLALWLVPWRADPVPDDPHGARLSARGDDFALDLTLRHTRGPVLHGRAGLDAKGPAAGQASWYYSLPWMRAVGTVTVDGTAHAVTGSAWMDHEFGTNQLAEDQVGWDWLALHLESGDALMLYRLRGPDGRPAPFSGGTWIPRQGAARPFRFSEVGARLAPGRTWSSPRSGAVYPVEWRITLPHLDLRLRVRALLDGQELAAGPGIPFPYWEGAVEVAGTRAGRSLNGEGYLEMTGYAGGLRSAFGLDPRPATPVR